MNDKMKKRLIVAGGLAVSVVLIVMIGMQFKEKPISEGDIPKQRTEVSNVKQDEITPSSIKIPKETKQNNGADDTGTEQKIQGDVPKKPTYTKEQLTNPAQKPNGEKVNPPKAEEKDTAPKSTPKPTNQEKKTETKTETKTKSSGGLPGFDKVPDGGANQVTEDDEMYENGNKIGKMN